MTIRRGVSINVDPGFFKVFENEREKQQGILRKKLGSAFNLTQRNFTQMLSVRKFKFEIPSHKTVITRRRVRRRRSI